MKELKVFDFNGKNVIDSRLVAEMIGMQHKELLRKIRGYDEILLSAKLRSVDFLRFSEILSSRPVSPHFFNLDVTNSNFRPDIRQIVRLNFQQSFSSVVWKAQS